MDEQECDQEVHSWSHFTPDQIDSYWIRCTLAVPHDEHEDENTGLRWSDDATSSEKEPLMPNQNTYYDDKTQTKAMRALTKDGALDLEQAIGAIERLQDAGLLFREPARRDSVEA